MKPNDAYRYLASRSDLVRRLPGELSDKKYIASFEGVHTGKQLALWRDLTTLTRVKVEDYGGEISGATIVSCAKNADLVDRLKNGRGVCVKIESEGALVEFVEFYFGATSKAALEPATSEVAKSVKPAETTTEHTSVAYSDFGEAPNDDPSSLNEFARKVRAGQRAFRNKLIELYEGKCAISGEPTQHVLEAAHILDHASSGINHSDNGLLLRSDIHLLFDKGYVAIDPDSLQIWVHNSLRGTAYWDFNGASLRKRSNGQHPGKVYLLNKWYEKRA